MAKNVDVAGRRIAKKGEPRLARYTEKEVTPVIELFADWLETETGLTLNERDRKVLFIGSALRGQFQKSDVNQSRIVQRKEEMASEVESREARRAERAERKAAKAAAPKVSKTAKAVAKTAGGAKPKPTKSAPAKASTGRRRPASAGKSRNADF